MQPTTSAAEPPETTSDEAPAWRPLVARTSGSAEEGVYGLILATSVIAVHLDRDPPDAGRVGLAVLVTAVVLWLAHVYADVLGVGVSEGRTSSRAAVAQALREHGSLLEVAIPLLFVLGLGAIGAIPHQAAHAAATVVALVELAAAGAYSAIRRRAGLAGTLVSAAVALALGLVVVLLLAHVH